MAKIAVSRSHPRYLSLFYRDMLANGVKKGLTSLQGLTAHGRGEAFDYLIGEKTCQFALSAIKTASAMLILAKYPVLSINGNTSALIPKEYIQLAKLLDAKLEINLFHKSSVREQKILNYFKHLGAKEVFLADTVQITTIKSNRRKISSKGQAKADVILIPLEDGDRTQALISLGKKVITIDLNPLSRTAQKATITIIDNIVRAIPILVETIRIFQHYPRKQLLEMVQKYDNSTVISQALAHINSRLNLLISK